MMSNYSCDNCVYSGKGNTFAEGYRVCRRNPPIVGVGEDYNCWPVIYLNEYTWCGEYAQSFVSGAILYDPDKEGD